MRMAHVAAGLLVVWSALGATAGEPAAGVPRDSDAAPAAVEQPPQQSPDALDLLHARGAAQRRRGDYAGAAATYERILAAAPGSEKARNLLAMVLLRAAQDAGEAEAPALLERAAALAPGSALHQEAYLASLAESGRNEALVEAHAALPEGTPLSPDLQLKIAAVYRDRGDPDRAAALYRNVLAAAPGHLDAGLGLALALFDGGDHPAAAAAIDAVLESHPDSTVLLLARAAIHWKAGTRVLALDTFDRILTLQPGHADAVNLKAQLLAEMGYVSLARELADAHPGLLQPHVLRYIEEQMAGARLAWNEGTLATNILQRLVPDQILALCYHDIPIEARAPLQTAAARFVQQIEYLRTHDYHFVSAGDVLAARRLERELPENPVLLTFDHGYASLISSVMPILELYRIPATVSLFPEWIEQGPPLELPGSLLTWPEVADLSRHPLITLGVQPQGLFNLARCNPQGDMTYAAVARVYNPDIGGYENDAAYRERIRAALKASLQMVNERVGKQPRVIAWPHGARNAVAGEEARQLGIMLELGLARTPRPTNTEQMERLRVLSNPDMLRFIDLIKSEPTARPALRAVRLRLDEVDDRNPHELSANLDRLIERLQALAANTAIVHACTDADSDGNVEATYFPTGILRVRHDILDHAVERLRRAGLSVFVSMPALSMEMPSTVRHDNLLVMEIHSGDVRPTFAGQKRLSPFNDEARDRMLQLYRDLASHVRMDGIVIGDDAYLTDGEDYNPEAQRRYLAAFGVRRPGVDAMPPEDLEHWARLKTTTLSKFVSDLARAVQRYRPQAQSARCLLAPALHNPASEKWLAQCYGDSLQLHDLVIVEAYIEMGDVSYAGSWLRKLVQRAAEHPAGLRRTLFELQAFDWQKQRWLGSRTLRGRLDDLTDAGALHIGYTPDGSFRNAPDADAVRRVYAP